MGMLQHNQCPVNVPDNEPSLDLKSMDHYTGTCCQIFGVKLNTGTWVRLFYNYWLSRTDLLESQWLTVICFVALCIYWMAVSVNVKLAFDHAVGHMTYIGSRPSDHYFRSVCWFVCLSVCLFVCLCRVFLSRLWSDFDQTRTYVICLGLVVSPRI